MDVALDLFGPIADDLPAPVAFLDAAGRLIYANRAYRDRLAVRGEILGRPLAEVLDAAYFGKLRPHLNAALAGEKADVTLPAPHPHLGVRHLRTVLLPRRAADGRISGVLLYDTDVTDALTARAAQRDSESRYRLIVELAPDMIVMHRQGVIEVINPAGARMLGAADAAELVGRKLMDFVHPAYRGKALGRLARLKSDRFVPLSNIKLLRQDGTTVMVESTGALTNPENPLIITVARDMSDRVEARAELVQASKLATLGQVAAGVAHELNQPLAVIGMSAEGALSAHQEGAVACDALVESLRTIAAQARRMSDITSQLGGFSRRQSDDVELLDPVECVENAVGLIAHQFQLCDITVAMDLAPCGACVAGQAVQVEQVLLNLLTNARDAIEARRAETPGADVPGRVRVAVARQDGQVTITVSDNGGGVPAALRDSVFDAFFTTKPPGIGTGLGLSVSAGIVREHGGRIALDEGGEGAVFRVVLPALTDDLEAASQVPAPVATPAPAPAPAPDDEDEIAILVVDDEPLIASEIKAFLERRGCRVTTAAHGEEALARLRDGVPDALVTDLRMPGMDGLRLVRRVHQDHPDLPSMVMTGGVIDAEERAELDRLGCRVLFKPLSLRDLWDVLGDLSA